jgi:hypothetical protein
MRRVVGFAISDAGFACYQMSCAHIVWDKPKTRQGVTNIRETEHLWESGDREIYLPCRKCAQKEAPKYPLGVTLPVPLPVPVNKRMKGRFRR